MGKLKITKNKKKHASGMPNWLLTTIVIVVIVAVLGTCVATFASTDGFVMRYSNAMTSDDYKVSGNMMKYYYMSTYSNFANTYSSYMPYFSLGSGTAVSEHKNITFGGTDEDPNTFDATVLGEFEGTWFDYFMNMTQESVKALLMYCEKADELGIAIDDEDRAEIENSIDETLASFRETNGDYPEATCLSAMYGNGIKRSDIRAAMELSTLAEKCQTKIIEDIQAAVGDDRINAEYDKNALEYDLVDYVYYKFSVTYDEACVNILGEDYEDADVTAKKTEIDAEYKKLIDEAKAKAEALKATADLAAFKAYLYNYIANDRYQDLLDAKELSETDLPSEEQLAKIKETLIANVIKEVTDGEESAKDDVKETKPETEGAESTFTMYDINITSKFATAIKTVKESLFSSVNAVNTTYTVDKGVYPTTDDEEEEEDKFAMWAFSADRVAGDKTIISDGDGSGDGEFKVEDKSFNTEIYILTAPRYKHVDVTRDIAYMMFTSRDDAVEAIKKLDAIESLTTDSFQTAADAAGSEAHAVYEDYIEGEMQSTSFDEWLYDEETVKGSYTATPIVMTDGSYMVAYYAADGDLAWKVRVKNSLVNDDYTAFEEELKTTYEASIVVRDWVITQISKDY